MNRIIGILMVLVLCLTPTAAFASEIEGETTEPTSTPIQQSLPETTEDRSSPRLMVTAYSLDTKNLTPDKTSLLKIVLHNFSETKSLRNVKLSLFDESGEIEIEGMATKYLDRIYVGEDYIWEIKLTAMPTAEIGKHKLTVTGEYEDLYFSSFTSSDVITLNVTQTVGLDHSGIKMPDKIVEGETNTLAVTLMNTGKTDIRNCKLTFSSDTLESSGTSFAGEIKAGESTSVNLNYKQPLGKIGKAEATVEISFEDALGNKKSEKVKLSTVVEKKVEVAEKLPEEEEKKTDFWWLFVLIGTAAGGALGYGIPAAIRSRRQRKEDELRL